MLLLPGIRCLFHSQLSSLPPRCHSQAHPTSPLNRSTSKTSANCPVHSTNFVPPSVHFERKFAQSRERSCNTFTPCTTVLTILSWWQLGRKVSTWWGFYAIMLPLEVLRGEDRCREGTDAALAPGLVKGTVASIVVL